MNADDTDRNRKSETKPLKRGGTEEPEEVGDQIIQPSENQGAVHRGGTEENKAVAADLRWLTQIRLGEQGRRLRLKTFTYQRLSTQISGKKAIRFSSMAQIPPARKIQR